jgi:hypothetical protein
VSLLRPAQNTQAFFKGGFQGKQGSGKTTTAALLQVGVSKELCGGAPVGFFETESGSSFLIPIFAAEQVEFFTTPVTRSLADLLAFLDEAKSLGCCAVIIDSITHVWMDVLAAAKKKFDVDELEFRHMDAVKSEWKRWTDAFTVSPLHVVVCGRLGYEWSWEKNERGKRELVKGDSKMKAEGEFGYEPNFVVELEAVRDADDRFIHRAYVDKDRSWKLNGKTFDFKDRDAYKAGDYKEVFNAFRPHFDTLRIGGPASVIAPVTPATDLFTPEQRSNWQERSRRRVVAGEEIEGAMTALWPGQDKESKKVKVELLHALFGSRSWTFVESLPYDRLESAVALLGRFAAIVKEDGVNVLDLAAVEGALTKAMNPTEPF